MRKALKYTAAMLLVTSLLSGCIIAPWDGGYDYGYGGGHHRGYYGGYYGGYHGGGHRW